MLCVREVTWAGLLCPSPELATTPAPSPSPAGARPANPNVFYAIICRAALGHFVATSDGETSLPSRPGEKPHPIFAKGTSKRELAPIPESPRGTLYHSMCVQIGGKVKRHREFVVFHSDRIYPEYVVAFNRV